ncbi:hypothetical protein ABZ759_02655 [Streptomyces sp. NPDC047860]
MQNLVSQVTILSFFGMEEKIPPEGLIPNFPHDGFMNSTPRQLP